MLSLPQIIDLDYAPGAVRVSKSVYRLVDLDASNGTEISLGGAGEMWLYSDQPINLKVGEAPTNISKVTQLHLSGYLTKIRAYRPLFYVGRLVVYTGFPTLGRNFRREDYFNRSRYVTSGAGVNWPASALYVDLPALTLPSNMAKETLFLWAVGANRSNNKVITHAEYIESETGFSYPIWFGMGKIFTPMNRFSFSKSHAVRLPSSGNIRIYGESDAAAQTLDWWTEFSYL